MMNKYLIQLVDQLLLAGHMGRFGLLLVFCLTSACNASPGVTATPITTTLLTATCCDSLAALPYQNLSTSTNITATINGRSSVYDFPTGLSRFLAYRLPESSAALTIKLQSQADKTLFEPTVMLLNERFEVTRILAEEHFSYEPARGFKGDSVDGRFRIAPTYANSSSNERYMVIYTTPIQMAGQTTLLHPAKAFAMARGNQPPAIADPIALHTDHGKIKITIDQDKYFVEDTYIPPRSQEHLMANPHVDKPVTKPEATEVLAETESFYRSAVSQAVSAGNLDKALQLVEESQRLGMTSIRTHFLQLLKQ